jgi:acetolactate synthase-1/3 small subunit
MKRTLSITAFNAPGVLSRIASVFSSRGFNLESIAVGPCEKSGVSRIIIVVPGNQHTIDQVAKQLNKLVQIIDIKNVTDIPCVERELMLIKVMTSTTTRSQIMEIAQIFRCKIVDISEKSITIEVTGDPGKTIIIEQLLNVFTILQIVRTGKISMEREAGIDTEYIKNN